MKLIRYTSLSKSVPDTHHHSFFLFALRALVFGVTPVFIYYIYFVFYIFLRQA